MSTENVKILLRRGFRDEITSATLETGEMGFTTDTNQLYIGTDRPFNEIQFDPFVNAHGIVQTWLDTSGDNPFADAGLVIDEDLVIRNIPTVLDAAGNPINGTNTLLTAMSSSSEFHIDYARPKGYVEVVTENSFTQLFADQHLSSLDTATGVRPSLFRKSLKTETGTFLRYNKGVCTTFFIDYYLVQTKVQTDGTEKKFLRVGQIKVINGVPQGIDQVKLTDDNTEMWQDNSDDIADLDEFSNIEFDTVIDGDNIEINFTQGTGFETEISYTVKRWSM